jgi:uncharacterized protein YbjT (DUF2867 family)
MILITTAGKVGGEAASLLSARDKPVRVLARNPENDAVLSQAGAEVVEGDLEVPASIDAATRDVSSVILVSLAIPIQELDAVDSAVRAGVDHVVKITSKASADSPIARRRAQTEIAQERHDTVRHRRPPLRGPARPRRRRAGAAVHRRTHREHVQR